MTKKFIVQTEYNSGLMFDDVEVASYFLEATPVKTQGYRDDKWQIDDRKIKLFAIDDSELIVDNPKEDENAS